MAKPPVRALTLGLAARHPLAGRDIDGAARALQQAQGTFEQAGYEVQTVRLSARPITDDLAGWSGRDIVAYGAMLQGFLDGAGVAFCSVGPVPTEAAMVAELIGDNRAINASMVVGTVDGGVDMAAARAAAETMLRLGTGSPEGFGNFNFAATACLGPGPPFFPGAFHFGPPELTLCLQGAGIIAEALAGGAELSEVADRVRAKVLEHAMPVVALAGRVAQELGVALGGIDVSPAPLGEDSIAGALEAAGHGPFGGPGSLSLAGAVTEGLRSTGLATRGYCGLMLPLMEDAGLVRRWEQGWLRLDKLIAFSAVCGTGLDTVPVPGGTPPAELARVISDVASLAVRLRKPLSVRVLPIAGKGAGDRTTSHPLIWSTH